MTWIVDGNGTRWVEVPQRKRRKSPRALRFANIKVGDQLMLKPKPNWHRGIPHYIIVTDLWFDPVAGQEDPVAGQMVGYSQITMSGDVRPRKSSTTIRGLASQQYVYADIDYIALCKARGDAMQTGEVVGIGAGTNIRKRPKIAGL
jgi:hypothetical protein